MKVRQWMTRAVMTLKPHDSLQHVHDRLRKHRINQFPVVRDGSLVGIVTDRDVRNAYPSSLRRIRTEDIEEFAEERTVEQIMTREVVTICPEAEAALRLRQYRFGSLPVIEEGKLIGIITRSDLLEAMLVGDRK
jgi:acetoin utilization protein AcuB